MNHRVILSPDAQSDINSAVRWYQRTDPNLAFRFTLETLAMLHRIAQFPYKAPLINATVRRALLNRFPYAIYYSLKNNGISVIAVLHQRRADSIWMDRENGRN